MDCRSNTIDKGGDNMDRGGTNMDWGTNRSTPWTGGVGTRLRQGGYVSS